MLISKILKSAILKHERFSLDICKATREIVNGLEEDHLVLVWELENLWYLCSFRGRHRLTRQGLRENFLEVSRRDLIKAQFDYEISSFSCSTVGTSRYILRRLYCAYPYLHALVQLNCGNVSNLVVSHFGLEALLTCSRKCIRERAKEYLDRRQT